jgi:hypothetical protein
MASMRVSPTTVSRSSSIMALPFFDLAQCVGFATIDAVTWGAEQALKAMIEYQVESLRFLARRTYCNLEFLRHLRHCAGWQDTAPGARRQGPGNGALQQL